MNQKGILRRMFMKYSSQDDIKNYCFDLGIEYKQLGNTDNLNEKVRHMIDFVCQRKMQENLRDYLVENRPEIFWGEIDWANLCNNKPSVYYIDNGFTTIKIAGEVRSFNKVDAQKRLAILFGVKPEQIIISSVKHGSIIIDVILSVEALQSLRTSNQFSIHQIDYSLANLREINLKGANLREINFFRADFREANLQGVDLKRSVLREANLEGANLKNAKLDPDFDMSKVSYNENTRWPWDEDPKEEEEEEEDSVPIKLFVGGVPYAWDDDKLKSLFIEFGTVLSAIIIMDRETNRSRGFGFVEMANSSEGRKAIKELNDAEVDGRTLTVNEARPRENRGGRRS